MLRFKHYISLLEAKIDDYKAQERNISTEHDPEAQHKSAADIIDHFHKHSPNGNVQHTRWMIDRYKKGEMKQEDAPDMHNTLNNFEKYKHNLPKKKIEQYKSISELKTAIHPYKERDEGVKAVNKNKIDKGSTVTHDSPNVTAYHIHTTEAAQELGKSPKGEKLGWCTSHPDPDENMFNHYNKESKGNFHILHMHKEEFPYRRIGGVGASGQFQDENNKLIKGKHFHDLLKRNPELEKIHAVTDTNHYKTQKATNPKATKEDLDKLVNDKDDLIRQHVAANKNATKEHLDKLVNDKDSSVRMRVVTHKNATKEHLNKLSNDNEEGVRQQVAENKNASKEHLDKLSDDKHPWVRSAVAANENATKEHLGKLSNDKDSSVRQKVAENKNTSKEHLNKLSKDENEYVRIGTTHNQNIHKDHLDNLINDEKKSVRYAAVTGPSKNKLTKDHLDKLSNDSDEYVRMAAQREINNRKGA